MVLLWCQCYDVTTLQHHKLTSATCISIYRSSAKKYGSYKRGYLIKNIIYNI